MKLYGMTDSGNCYKPWLLLGKLGIPFTHVETSSRDGTTHTPGFLAKNAIGKVPVLELDDGRFLSESNAILLYLAEGSRFLPDERYLRALVYQWLFFEQYSHEPNVAVRRSLMVYPERAAMATPERLIATLEGGNRALAVMERQLSQTPFLTGDTLTVADISLYAYTHDADAGGFDLTAYPAVSAWLGRVEADPGHAPMEHAE